MFVVASSGPYLKEDTDNGLALYNITNCTEMGGLDAKRGGSLDIVKTSLLASGPGTVFLSSALCSLALVRPGRLDATTRCHVPCEHHPTVH